MHLAFLLHWETLHVLNHGYYLVTLLCRTVKVDVQRFFKSNSSALTYIRVIICWIIAYIYSYSNKFGLGEYLCQYGTDY